MNSVDQPKPVFLSYRRNDQPGYVALLRGDIVRAFGNVVFRDVDSLSAGDQWERALKDGIAQARVVLAIIGDRWLAELSKREMQETDYVSFELNTARELNIDVIPVLLDNVSLPVDAALGDLAWLRDIQQHSLSDTQGRWQFDSNKLVDIIGKTALLQRITEVDNVDARDILINCGITPEQVNQIIDLILRKKVVPLEAYDEVRVKLGIHENAVQRFFEIIGEKIAPDEDRYLKLAQLAQRHITLLSQTRTIDTSDERVRVLIDQADQAIAIADYDHADSLLEQAEKLDFEIANDKLKNAATSRHRRGQISLTKFEYLSAAHHFSIAAERLPFQYQEKRIEYGLDEANAFKSQGDEQGDNEALHRSIAKYKELLPLFNNKKTDTWARTQNNLGLALWKLGDRESGTGHLEESVATYRSALKEQNRERVPLDWAQTQNNLGLVLWTLGERESGTDRLQEAVAAYRSALEERTRERVPLDWAQTQNNLGIALWTLGARESDNARLKEAVTAYRSALEERTRERVPLGWALAQNNLGIALWTLGERESDTTRLEEAVSAYRSALEVQTRERVPLQWAQTQNNLGNALCLLGKREPGTARLKQAVAAFRSALDERTRERVPLRWAQTQNNLGIALWTLGERESGTTRLEEAFAALNSALEEWTRERVPLDWAITQKALGGVLWVLGQRKQDVSQVTAGKIAVQNARSVEIDEAGYTQYANFYEKRLKDIEDTEQSLLSLEK